MKLTDWLLVEVALLIIGLFLWTHKHYPIIFVDRLSQRGQRILFSVVFTPSSSNPPKLKSRETTFHYCWRVKRSLKLV
jgi:hypothetical protein